jgi:galactokinase/mevalonate kinase-like predicted kinase
MDWTGKRVLSKQIRNKEIVTLNLTGLPNGMYWLKLDDGIGQIVIKN